MNLRLLYSSVTLLLLLGFIYSCETDLVPPDNITTNANLPGTTFMEASPQRSGDAEKGKSILLNGDYIGSGIPLEIYKAVLGDVNENVLERQGENATIDPSYTAFQHKNGTMVVSPNCLQCHGSYLNGEYVIGLGNLNQDFTIKQNALVGAVDVVVKNKHGVESKEWEAYEDFRNGMRAVAEYVVTNTVGANPADKLFAILAAHRDKNTLEWREEPSQEIPDDFTNFTDIPPWWVLKKKHKPLYTGTGGGDWAKLFMAASTLTLKDASDADKIDEDFTHVLAYLKTLEAPKNPNPINETLVQKGETIFAANCSGCHGTYGENETYPNLMVDLSVVGTDPEQSNAVKDVTVVGAFLDWFNESWFAKDEPGGELLVTNGYVAQPLDGIWASAPYLHNGSVPTLYELLKSSERPTYWKRTQKTLYDTEKVGWQYSEESGHTDKFTYDTTARGYGNGGHTFGDALNEEDRMALIEYLKTI